MSVVEEFTQESEAVYLLFFFRCRLFVCFFFFVFGGVGAEFWLAGLLESGV